METSSKYQSRHFKMTASAAVWTAVFALMQATIMAVVIVRLWLAARHGYAIVVGMALAIPVVLGLITAFGADEGNAFSYVIGSTVGLVVALPLIAAAAAVAIVRSAQRRRE